VHVTNQSLKGAEKKVHKQGDTPGIWKSPFTLIGGGGGGTRKAEAPKLLKEGQNPVM